MAAAPSRRAAGTAQGACAASPALRLLRQRRGAGAAAMGTGTGSGTCPPGLGLLLVVVVVVLLGEARAEEVCSPPERLQYAELTESFSTMQSFPVGTTVTYVCRPGYMKIPGKSLDRTCGKDLRWSPTEEFCTARKCRHPGEPENGIVHVTDLTFGSQANFSCHTGFRIRGSSEITCVVKNKAVDWDGVPPFCERVPCEPPPSIANGYYTEVPEYVYQTTVTYRCNDAPRGEDPYSLVGTPSIFCTLDGDLNGVWSGPPPQCKVVKCENPKVPNGKKVSGFGPLYSYQHSVTFECDPGYFMIGRDVITCQEDNTWHPPQPTCEKITEDRCGAPKISHGQVIPLQSEYKQGESVQLRCNLHCAFPDGAEEITVTCEGQNTWSSVQNCACKPVHHDSSPVISHGRVIYGQKPEYAEGDSITIECYAGYTLHGADRIVYMGEGKWNPEVPTCHLSAYVIAIICVITVVLVSLAAFWVYKKCFSQEGSTPQSRDRNEQQKRTASQM
uniref:Complement component 4 binding protein alpha n=1 Tax=Anas zonorhyncha TaxID=75864 RepID=A0A8B9ZUR3_9AVES